MNIRVIFLLAVLALVGCERSPYAGYKLVDDDVHMRLLVIGDGEALPTDSDSVVVRLRMGRPMEQVGAIFSTERAYLVKDIRSGALRPVLRRSHVGDSLSVVAPAAAWPWSTLANNAAIDVPDTGMVQAEILLQGLRTPAMVRAEMDRLRQHDPLGYELRLVAAWVERSKLPLVQWGTSDVYYHIAGQAVDTNGVVVGDEVTISYKGSRLEDGQVFDDTRRNGAPLTFIYGDRDQVINGLEVAIQLLREGQEGTFILPSLYAFGTKGIPGVLEPDMPVVYTVRLEKVVRAKGVQLR
ncbi:MAG: FKBP-type peptidyl-prolyl cis-trans isomerase [Flavobacteriales bacterium]|jgi:hypothetical protein|nr:MAG: FKBP-type peptidyl-prolyl cis-trans isomerase [Flavobacteriales bacterium]